MDRRRLIRNIILLSAATAMTVTALAGDRRTRKERQPFTPQHEVRLSWGASPFNLVFDMSYPRQTYVSKTRFSGAVTASYGYQLKRWLSLHANLTYSGLYRRRNMKSDKTYVGTDREHVLTFMPMVRFTWLNRPAIRLYSSVGAGAAMYLGRTFVSTESERYRGYTVAMQITPLGIAFGRSFFGYVEGGFGAHGWIVAGFGYRFNDQIKSR